MQPKVLNSTLTELDVAVHDLGPLAWVLDELRKSLDVAVKALKRFVRDAESARRSDLAALDGGPLRIARQQIHQAVGALEMVGLHCPALVLRAMESGVQKFLQQPEQCNELATAKIELASFALTEYLEAVLAGRPISPVSLFPQYRDVLELVKADRIHPADLWAYRWQWLDIDLHLDGRVEPQAYDNAARSVLDRAVLQLMKGEASLAAHQLKELSLGFSSNQTDRQARIFWLIAAAYFEALTHQLIKPDVYVRRASSRILMQYASLARGEGALSDRLAHDLLFFCAQASTAAEHDTPVLSAVRSAYGLLQTAAVDYDMVQFGRFDPTLLAQARKRITLAKETWSSLSAGELSKFKTVTQQFSLVADSLLKLHPPSELLAQALTRAVDTTVRSGQAPAIELAMEVASSVLFLEAAFDDLDPTVLELTARTVNLAERLEGVRTGSPPQPLEAWMEELYCRVSDKHTMGSVVGELRVSLSELEKGLDTFFRHPEDKSALQSVPAQLAQMRGVLSVLGLDQAARAVLRMRESVEQMLETEADEQLARAAGTFEHLGNSLGALSFLIDMLNYQPALAKKMFVFDEESGELKPLLGRLAAAANAGLAEPAALAVSVNAEMLSSQAILAAEPADKLTHQLVALATHAALADQPALAQTARDAAAAVLSNDAIAASLALGHLASTLTPEPADSGSVPVDYEEDDLRDIFLQEAREVLVNGMQAVHALESGDDDEAQLTALRRAFHTLKGSSRMVGLNEFGEAAWSLEKMLNSWLADQKSASDELRGLCAQALADFTRWVDDIAAGKDGLWSSAPVRRSADAMRMDGHYLPLNFAPSTLAPAVQAAPLASLPVVGASDGAVDTVPSVTEMPEIDSGVGDDIPGLLATPGEVPASAGAILDEVRDSLAELALLFRPALAEPPPAELLAAPVSTRGSDTQAINAESLWALAGPNKATPALGVETPSISATAPQALAPDGEVFQAAEDPATDSVDPVDAAEQVQMFESDAPDVLAEFEWLSQPDPLLLSTRLDAAEAHVTAANPTPDTSDAAEMPVEMAWLQSDFRGDEPSQDSLSPLESESDDQIKVIGSLRVGLPLYNVYLSEADEWSRRLVTEVAEWALEGDTPISESTVALAHALGGSSATVGFDALSAISRAFEQALQQSHAHNHHGASQYGQLFVDISEDIRRLLHHFAAGFLKEPDGSLLEALKDLEFIDSVMPPAGENIDAYLYGSFARLAQGGDEHADGSATTETDPVIPDASASDVAPRETVGTEVSAVALQPEQPSAREARPLAVSFTSAAPAVRLVRPAQASFRLAGVPANFNQVHDDDIDAVDAVDEELFPIFEEEGAELMPQLGGALRQWSARPDNPSARLEVLRALHTLKGSARLAGALRLGEMAHRIESEIEHMGSEGAVNREFEPLLARFDAMQAVFENLRHPPLVRSAPELPPYLRESLAPVEQALPAVVRPADVPDAPGAVADVSSSLAAASGRKVVVPPPQAMVMQQVRQAATASVRVRSQLLERMVNQAGEVMITRARLDAEIANLRSALAELTGNLNRLREQLHDIELQAETQMQSRLAHTKEDQAGFDPLEFDRFTRVQELTRMMAESVNDVATVQRTLQRTVESTEDDLIAQAHQTRELQRDLLRTRMVEFESIADRLYRVVRLASKEAGKQVKLDLLGGTIEMDRSLLDRMTPAFEHLLRNCAAHGIESPQARLGAGKDAVGLITVHLRHDGNDVSVDFSDDGAGLDLQRIRKRALALGLVAPDQVLDDAEAARLIFLPGFSTAEDVTELSGRGIGMEVVRAEVNAVGGRIETSSVTGQGTHFKLVLPLTTAVTQVVMVRAGNLSVGVPASVVETVRRATAAELQQAYASGTLELAGEAVPFYWAGALLQASHHSTEAQGKTTPVVVFRSAAQRIALHVDEVIGNQEVVVKHLGPQLAGLPGLAGMSVLPSGAVVLIYNPVALAAVHGAQAGAWSRDRAAAQGLEAVGADGRPTSAGVRAATPKVPLILVVDDSITVRRVTQRLLQREGYRVAMAADGLQALERMLDEVPSVVLSDIEMPRMDGFDLARNIRADVRLAKLPIIMITSRIAEKHREHARDLGVDHYLGKPYSEEELMALVRHYCAAEAAASA